MAFQGLPFLTRGAIPYYLRAMDTLLDRAPRPRGDCLGMFLRCLQVEKSCERLADLKPRAGEHAGEPNWRRSRPPCCAGARNCHPPMIDRVGSSLKTGGVLSRDGCEQKLLRKWWKKNRRQGQIQQRKFYSEYKSEQVARVEKVLKLVRNSVIIFWTITRLVTPDG